MYLSLYPHTTYPMQCADRRSLSFLHVEVKDIDPIGSSCFYSTVKHEDLSGLGGDVARVTGDSGRDATRTALATVFVANAATWKCRCVDRQQIKQTMDAKIGK